MSGVEASRTLKRKASSQIIPRQQTTLAEAFSNSKKRAKGNTTMLIDLTKTPASPPANLIGGHKANTRKLTVKNLNLKDSRASQTDYYEDIIRNLNDAVDLILSGSQCHHLQASYKRCEAAVKGGQAGRCAKLVSGKLYSHAKSRRGAILERIRSGEAIVPLVVTEWRTWSYQISQLGNIFLYLDRTYLLNSSTEEPLLQSSTALFQREIVMQPEIKDGLINGVIDIFNHSRAAHGADVQDGQLLQSAIRLFESVRIYDTVFEPAFLLASEKYFQIESASAFKDSVYDLLDLISSRIASEDKRCDQYLRLTTKQSVQTIVQLQLIKSRAEDIVNGFDKVLEARDHDRLKQMYDLLAMVDESERLRNSWASCVKSAGISLISDKANDQTMVTSLLTFKEDMDTILLKSFASEDLFSKALRDQFSSFINSRGDVPAEMMAKFIDSVLRSGNKKFSETDLEAQMARLMDIFRFIASKDVFEAFYKKDLAKRLLLNKSASADAERSLLSKLKVECGPGFTQKLEGMFRDIDISRDYGKNFQNKKLDVSVLSQGSWPTYPEVKARIPDEMTTALKEFEDYYLKANNGRKLMWRHSLGHCQIKASFPKGDKELMVSLFQGIVILSFNSVVQSLSYKEIQANTGLDDKELTRTLQSLACGRPETRVLVKSPKGKDVNPDDIFKVNENFSNPKTVVKINQIQMKETSEENQATHERIVQDRSFEIQAAITRIMKAAKKKTHSELIAATIDTIKGRGIPSVAAIKQAIEKLLDREYLSRHENAYVYEA